MATYVTFKTNAQTGQIPTKLSPETTSVKLAAELTPTASLSPPLTPQALAVLEAYVEQARVRYKVPGAAVAVVQGDKIVYVKGFCQRDLDSGKPVTSETLFAVASMTKPITSMLVATLVDEGKLNWNQRFVEIFPKFKLSDPAVTQQIRVRALLNMSSGVGRWGSMRFKQDMAEETIEAISKIPIKI